MSQICKLTLKQISGLLTELQSDTIFGHFCWRLKDFHGEEKLNYFLDLYRNRNPVFTISNSFFERDGILYLPNPHLPFKEKQEDKTKDEKIKSFLAYKDSKSKKFLTLVQFNEALTGNDIANDDKKQPKYVKDLRTSVEISRETFSSKESQLFSYAPFYIEEEIISSKKNVFSKTNTVIFIKILNESEFKNFDCEKILKEVFKTGFGKKKSSGYGEFDVSGFDKFEGFKEPEDSNGFITLSNYLPSEFDGITADNSYYELNIKYGKFGEELALIKNPFKKPIVFMIQGSCFKTVEKKEFFGRCTINGEISSLYEEAIQNGIALSLKLKISKFE